ncbi:MAG: hypothetical protein RL189_2383 [Pseudomonadota bacterium]|jgi:hypothetical protein
MIMQKASLKSKLGIALPSAVLLCLAASCARDGGSEADRLSELNSSSTSSELTEVEKITFVQWCERWGLTCPGDDGKSFDSQNELQSESKESQQWQAIAKLFDRFMVSGSNFSLEDSELNSAKARLLMTQIGWDEVYGEVLEVLNRSRLKKIAIDPQGQIRFEARPGMNDRAGTVRGRSGMRWTFGNQGTVSVGETGSYLFGGLWFAAANSLETDVFGRLGYNDQDKTTWSGSNIAVTHVPEGFFIRDLPVRWEKFSEFKREPLLRSVTELRNLVFSQGRSVKLNTAFFDTAARSLPVFVDDAKVLPAITKLTDALGSLEMKAPVSDAALAQIKLERAASVMCRIEMSGTPPIELTLDRRFGIQNAYTNEKAHAQVDLFGINIKARVGIPISFNLRRVDVEPKRVVVKGVPVVGEIAIPLPDETGKFDKELKKFECTERL